MICALKSAGVSGQSERHYLQQFGERLTPERTGAALVELASAYLLTSAGLRTSREAGEHGAGEQTFGARGSRLCGAEVLSR